MGATGRQSTAEGCSGSAGILPPTPRPPECDRGTAAALRGIIIQVFSALVCVAISPWMFDVYISRSDAAIAA